MPFAMGLAWWDYWLPAALSLKGRQVLTLDRPTVAHLIHKEPSLDDSWRQEPGMPVYGADLDAATTPGALAGARR